MGVNYFTEEQVKELEKNPYVKKVSNKSITYAKEFKYGFDPNVLGAKRRNTFTERLKKQTQRVEGFKDTRKDNSGRPSTKELSLEEQIERLKHKNKVLQQENDFLKRVRFINRKQISKQSKNKQ